MKPVVFRPAANFDVEEIRQYLRTQRPGTEAKFMRRLNEIVRRLHVFPELYGRVWRDARLAIVRGFKYLVIYRVLTDHVEVITVVHGSQRPSTWRSRV